MDCEGFISEKKAQKFVKDVQKIANELHKCLDNKLYMIHYMAKILLTPRWNVISKNHNITTVRLN